MADECWPVAAAPATGPRPTSSRNLATVGRRAGARRPGPAESRGAHARTDFPDPTLPSGCASSSGRRDTGPVDTTLRLLCQLTGSAVAHRPASPGLVPRPVRPPRDRAGGTAPAGPSTSPRTAARRSTRPTARSHDPDGQPRHREGRGDVQHRAGVADAASGGGTIFTEPVLVVNQKAKLIEINNEYAIYDQHGRQIGAVRQVGQSAAKKVMRVARLLRPVPDPQAPDRRHARQRAAGAHPAGQGAQVAGHRPGRRRAARSARSCSRT